MFTDGEGVKSTSGKKRSHPSKKAEVGVSGDNDELADLLPSSLDGAEMDTILDNAERFIEEAHDTLDELFSQTEEQIDDNGQCNM